VKEMQSAYPSIFPDVIGIGDLRNYPLVRIAPGKGASLKIIGEWRQHEQV
jgi:hypothetical protein